MVQIKFTIILFCTLNSAYGRDQFSYDFFDLWRGKTILTDTIADLSLLNHIDKHEPTTLGFIVNTTYLNGQYSAGNVISNFESDNGSLDYYIAFNDTTVYFGTNSKNGFKSFNCVIFDGIDWIFSLNYHYGEVIEVMTVKQIHEEKFVFNHILNLQSVQIRNISDLMIIMKAYMKSEGIIIRRDMISFPEYWYLKHSATLKWEDIFPTTSESFD